MRSQEEMRNKVASLREVAKEINERTLDLCKSFMEEEFSQEEYLLMNEAERISNQMLEIYSNIRAIKWCLGDINDLDFATTTGAGIIEESNRRIDGK